MNDYMIAVILGIVEGFTEYLPVSSTGHMILVGDWLGFDGPRASVFEVFIQLGAILSVLIIYKEKFIRMLYQYRCWNLFRRENWFRTDTGLTLAHVAAGIVPVMGIGYLAHHAIKTYLFSAGTVIIGLIIGGLFMLAAEKAHMKVRCKDVEKMTIVQAFLVGAFQMLALWPGFSRSGSTIAGGLFLGMSRKAAADFSFIIAVPVMIVACFYDLLKSLSYLSGNDLVMIAIGFVTAFIVAYVSVLWFLKFLNKSTLASFAYYRFVVALVSFLHFFVLN
ncbi:undecaprenyl-diphosphate phosphatase [Megasphaera hexanoica]|jgi:undecaprenyl-diphosphatase|uniref:Undecaprenyl-diphosphatase n=2 Tax=Megasphaera TaxID=906 RepID=A0A848BZG8_9FIRM|nr:MULTISPECIES: undecaprenyl-diphosphate phosphatase [Megasphaera]MCI5532640.1 undecaprenyl-diphosphate phosphatase [Caecibacter massiliensis]HAM03939.1 undecaprenyl-diphosphate phosphatase [Megasphaera sp.]AXB81582.1 UDP-diphosphatase [Megasphaera hexanoica]KUH56134.1 UDP-diphosphatase [Megasphaera sp. DJF_B143]NME27733.1 undecaprenyl-diphosphate phosphatase [Megasphaera hexanoica]